MISISTRTSASDAPQAKPLATRLFRNRAALCIFRFLDSRRRTYGGRPMISCEEINRMARATRVRPGRDLGIDLVTTNILTMIEALNAHHVLIAKALLELSSSSPASMSTETVRELGNMLMKD